MALIEFSTQIRVRYKDTDQMGIMHHSNYIVIYEMARTEWLREMGLPYAEFERRGVMSPIVEVQSRYHYPAFYDEVLTVSDAFAYEHARAVCAREGAFVGISSGAALCAAAEVAKRAEFEGKNIVAVFPDSANRYLSLL